MNKSEAKRILYEVLGPSIEARSEALYKCPDCQHHKFKLSINLDKSAFKCWVCDYSGRNIRRIIRRFGTYVHLQRWDNITDGVDLRKFSGLFDEVKEIIQTVELPPEFKTLATKNLPATARFAHRYLCNRGISDKEILRWKMGYCFEGEYRNRIVIPSFNDQGDVNYFIARSYNGDSYKYKNPKVSKNIIFNELSIDWDADLTIVEGVFDAVVAGNAVPILGSTLRPDSRLLHKIVLNDTPVYLALDADAIGKEYRIIQMLLQYDIELYKIDTSGYEDVGAMPKDVFIQRKKEAAFIDNDNYLLLNLLSAI